MREFGGLLCSGGEDATKKIKLGVGGGDIRNFFSKTNLSNSITHSLWHSCYMLSGNRSSLAHIMTWDFRLFILLSKCTKLMHFTIKCRKFSPGGACPRTPLGVCCSLTKCVPTNVTIKVMPLLLLVYCMLYHFYVFFMALGHTHLGVGVGATPPSKPRPQNLMRSDGLRLTGMRF